MRRLAAALLCGFLVSCASVPLEFRPYRACRMTTVGGRSLIDTGTVVGSDLDQQGRYWLFASDTFNPDRFGPDPKWNTIKVRTQPRPCPAAGPMPFTGPENGRLPGEPPDAP